MSVAFKATPETATRVDKPRPDVFDLDPTRSRGAHQSRVTPSGQSAPWLFMSAHGGCGATTLTRLARAQGAVCIQSDSGFDLLGLPYECGQSWPTPALEPWPFVIMVCRTHMYGMAWARDLATQYLTGRAPAGVQLLGLVTVADAPGRLPRPLAGAQKLLSGVYSYVWHVPYIDAYRLDPGLTGPPDLDPSITRVLQSIRTAVAHAKRGIHT